MSDEPPRARTQPVLAHPEPSEGERENSVMCNETHPARVLTPTLWDDVVN
jgi:hypothetical protein